MDVKVMRKSGRMVTLEVIWQVATLKPHFDFDLPFTVRHPVRADQGCNGNGNNGN